MPVCVHLHYRSEVLAQAQNRHRVIPLYAVTVVASFKRVLTAQLARPDFVRRRRNIAQP